MGAALLPWYHILTPLSRLHGDVMFQVCLCRLHCLVGDYAEALRIIAPLNLQNEAIFSRVAACHITLFYYVGFALIMSRRFVEAMRAYGRVLLYFHRTKK